MSGRGETPDEEDVEEDIDEPDITPGQTLYDEDGTAVGTVRGMEQGGLFVSLREGIETLSIEHARSGHSFGEAELMWRCRNCGEMGDIEGGLPDQCPNCGEEKENIMYWTED